MVGGESRKSRKPFETTSSTASFNGNRASTDFQCPSLTTEHGPSNKNTSSKGLTSYIFRNVWKNMSWWGKEILQCGRTTTSSENTGDVIVENTSMTIALSGSRWVPLAPTQPTTCSDRRALSLDRLYSGNAMGSGPAHHQLKPVDRSIQNDLPCERCIVLKRSVSRVLVHASNRTGAQLTLVYSSMRRNCRPPHEAMK